MKELFDGYEEEKVLRFVNSFIKAGMIGDVKANINIKSDSSGVKCEVNGNGVGIISAVLALLHKIAENKEYSLSYSDLLCALFLIENMNNSASAKLKVPVMTEVLKGEQHD